MVQRLYQAVHGFFLQDQYDKDLHIKSSSISLPSRFGLLDGSAERWTTFRLAISQLNANAPENTSYKVIFFGRHGEGYHNVAEAKYGTQAWDDYWSKLNGDGELVWGPDPDLTPLGVDQAIAARELWKAELPFGIPLPEKLYCSPLTRAIRTNILTFEGVITDDTRKTTIVENCREENGVHTCDKRRSRSFIKSTYPQLLLEEGFTEEDELWDANARETKTELDARARTVLDNVFEDGEKQFISITAHGGFIGAILRVTNHWSYRLATGGYIPIVIKGTNLTTDSMP
ncbi:hypothetical protein SERLA73DRAFT_178171 [Serpula lacrymans var. lacrymans S7.3]|uniref:Phosphoglycerate mutase-like protein n=2 Tax=Serpula lacrymans var. lacrymans TaxID=341189 RepID=F8PQV8_SERL3|nr:uncharacterized protein SERLADRAFT_462470 [Serpula lacrymans var. lacrymans S7.9]EGO02302.1 hypothetical protein SERLA73DRAFT_178171 [Serpula lacrymans var. lacrymans S7.3]EGO28043.1 hypothetical protein SERLADRAFT_462470 [Serpula lacrymans var. lacrymans S7.9]